LTVIAAPGKAGAAMSFQTGGTTMTDQTFHIRRLNDMTRTQPEIVNATWVTTRGVLHLLNGDSDRDDTVLPAPARVAALRAAIATFDDWTEGNDPYGEHDFGAFDLFDQRLFFKIDYYHPDHDSLAPVPSSIELCRRVLTVMLAEEY
jgi:Protein of unknown function (DUF3768)